MSMQADRLITTQQSHSRGRSSSDWLVSVHCPHCQQKPPVTQPGL